MGAEQEAQEPLELACFTLIIDDIVLPSGQTFMAQLGGGGSQTLFGYQLAALAIDGLVARAGLTAGIGQDLPPSCRDWLSSIGVDLQGLFVVAGRDTPRAWQVFEEDGRRTQIWRSRGDPCDALYAMLRPRLDVLPPHFAAAQNFHLGVNPVTPPLDLLRGLHSRAKAAGGLLSIEPFTTAVRPLSSDELQELLSSCDIYSPNLLEAQTMLGAADQEPPEHLAARLLEAGGASGAPLVMVRCGEQGSVVVHKPSRTLCRVPAVGGVNVVDVTGAGNSFCGAFLASLVKSLHRSRADSKSRGIPDESSPNPTAQQLSPAQLVQASAWGAAAASFMIEEQGVPVTPLHELAPCTHARVEAALQGVRVAELPQVQQHAVTDSSAMGSASSSQSRVAPRAAAPDVRPASACLSGRQHWFRQRTGAVSRVSHLSSLRVSQCVGGPAVGQRTCRRTFGGGGFPRLMV